MKEENRSRESTVINTCHTPPAAAAGHASGRPIRAPVEQRNPVLQIK